MVGGGRSAGSVGRQIFRAHHNPELGGASSVELADSDNDNDVTEKEPRQQEKMGSPHVSLDSWVYPHIEELAALGYIETAYLGLKPRPAWNTPNWSNAPVAQCHRPTAPSPRRQNCDPSQSGSLANLDCSTVPGKAMATVALRSVYAPGVFSVIGPEH